MNTGVHILFLGLMVSVRSVHARPETVWLEDVTTKFQTDKRTLGDPNLPDQLTFHIRRESDDLTLNLRRNYDIDPNSDIYVLQKMNDGQSILTKANNMEREDVAYYQDRENGAYMTVRCVKRSGQQCERVINGNLQLEDNSYHLQPVETIDSFDNLKEILDITGKRYLLLDQDNIHLETLVDNKDAGNVIRTNVAAKLSALFGRFTGMDKQNYFCRPESTLSSRNVPNLQHREKTRENNYNERRFDYDNTRQLKSNYYVKVAVVIDSSIWKLYSSRDKTLDPLSKPIEVQKRIREAFSHIINGVNLHYKSIDDPRISISIILHSFTFFKTKASFPHIHSKVLTTVGKHHIEPFNYLYDLGKWANKTTELQPASYDHVMLFTRHDLFERRRRLFYNGMSILNGVCDVMTKVSVVRVSYYPQAVKTAAHELGHKSVAPPDFPVSYYRVSDPSVISTVGNNCQTIVAKYLQLNIDPTSRIWEKCVKVGNSFHIAGSLYAKELCPYDFVFIVGTISIPWSEEERKDLAGANHDGEGDAITCKAEDSFIMSSRQKTLSNTLRYIENIWKFSICSIESFLKKLQYKDCVKHQGSVFNVAEWTMFMTNMAGDVFTPDELCYFFLGPRFKFIGKLSEEICYLLHCKDPATGSQKKAYINAARGTKCGADKWCIDGKCVAKDSK